MGDWKAKEMQVLVEIFLELGNYQKRYDVQWVGKGARKKMLCLSIHHTGVLGMTNEIFNDSYLDPREGIQLSMRTRSVYILPKPWRPLALQLLLFVNPVSLALSALSLRTTETFAEKSVNRSKFWSASVSSQVEGRQCVGYRKGMDCRKWGG